MDRPEALAERLRLPAIEPGLLRQALTHSSWVHEHPDDADGNNERLEYLGDAVISLAISEALYARHPDDDEGILSARRAAIVSSAGLARVAARIGLGEALHLGEGEARRGARRRPVLLASALEAVAGALFLDQGWQPARDWIVGIAGPEIDAATAPASLKSPKSRLQEHTQRGTGQRPEYVLVSATGPDHEKEFIVEVRVAGEPLGSGTGPSRRTAETAAASEAVAVLAGRGDESVGDRPSTEAAESVR